MEFYNIKYYNNYTEKFFFKYQKSIQENISMKNKYEVTYDSRLFEKFKK